MREEKIIVEYQNYIDHAPVSPDELFRNACKNDDPTIKAWRPIWMKHVKKNHENYKSFSDNSIAKFFGHAHQRPVIIAGSGPSLKNNVEHLRDRGDLTLISCLHNFSFFEDNNVYPDFYVSLDAGEVVVEEVFEGGKKTEQEYWDATKNKKLFCYIGTSPNLLAKWQGDVYFFNAPVPDDEYTKFVENIEIFNIHISNGGNVLGACFYIAKAHMGASIVAFIGADFCFSYTHKFHAWDSKYDTKLGNVMHIKDVFGNQVKTWASYFNFKGWFESMTLSVPGVYYNCSEGGSLGAYLEGNIRSIHQLPLRAFIEQVRAYEQMKESNTDPKNKLQKLLF